MDMRWRKQTHLCHLEKKKGPSWWVVNAALCKGTALGHITPNPFILFLQCAGSQRERAAVLRQNSRSEPTRKGKQQGPEHPGERRRLCAAVVAAAEQAPVSPEHSLNSFIAQAGIQLFARWSRRL